MQEENFWGHFWTFTFLHIFAAEIASFWQNTSLTILEVIFGCYKFFDNFSAGMKCFMFSCYMVYAGVFANSQIPCLWKTFNCLKVLIKNSLRSFWGFHLFSSFWSWNHIFSNNIFLKTFLTFRLSGTPFETFFFSAHVIDLNFLNFEN